MTHDLVLPLTALSVLGWLYLLVGRDAFWRAKPRLDQAPPPPQRWPDVVAVIPARNEAAYVGRALQSLVNQDYPGRLSIVLVDDHAPIGPRSGYIASARIGA